MPTYEYRCANGHDFEQFHRRISDAPATAECPQCHAPAERRISGGAVLLFKGSGFYLTDYGKNAHRGEAPKSDGAKSDGGSGAAGGKGEGSGSSSGSTGGSSGGSSGGSTGSSSGASSGASSGGGSGGGSGGASGGSSGAKSE